MEFNFRLCISYVSDTSTCFMKCFQTIPLFFEVSCKFHPDFYMIFFKTQMINQIGQPVKIS